MIEKPVTFCHTFRLSTRIMMHKAPKVEKMMTLWVKFPEGTLYGFPLDNPYIELKTHGKPRPRNTLTLLLPKKQYNACIAYYRYK